ncbi:hypothetical protein QJS04_geneDACA024496 [Acorus gramineus]|uniref:Protein kinase domain-containing protein n=1 Tax=Acorus gramineus TaxID=55184 RepID=A0AAV8ZXQ7_ACOGR|nr:hypothetical protein QJS04_geneDACA024496 [Acorus gramineus]
MVSFSSYVEEGEECGSPDRVSLGSRAKRSSASSGGRSRAASSSVRKEFVRKFVDCEILTANLEDWLCNTDFDVPFTLKELQDFDYALEAASFQQLIRMPNALHASTSEAVEAAAYLAIEDFLHASSKGLWERFWGQDGPMPFSVACLHSSSSKFYPAEKAIASGKLGGLCATALMLKNSQQSRGKWDQILLLSLLKPNLGSLSMEGDRRSALSILGEALFFALHVLLWRSLSRSTTVLHDPTCVFVLLVDSQYGGVLKLEGDVYRLNYDKNNVYESAAEWIKTHSKISVSPVDRIWNKLGNANWGDIGALQVLLATFHCMVQFYGMPKHSFEELATDHHSRLQNRRTERQLVDTRMNGNGMFRFQQRSVSPEIVEVEEESGKVESEEALRLEVGSVLWLEDSDWQKGYQINEVLSDGELPIYNVTPVEERGREFFLYAGSSPRHLELAHEDMNIWYHVQRQTKILNLMKQRGLSSRHLPQLVASGRLIHSGTCEKPSSSGNCSHPRCGTPILVTAPSGISVMNMVRNSIFTPDEALRCCHDCLSALSIASAAGIRHGNITPENVIHVSSGTRRPYYVLIGWGHAVLEDRDRPSMNLMFSSSYALLEGKLCSASDAESLIYLLYFCSGGAFPELDSVEGALHWRESSWSGRLIQQMLGDISAVLKAFADYVDSLCGTPYTIDYEIWLRRLKKIITSDEYGKEIDESG